MSAVAVALPPHCTDSEAYMESVVLLS